MIDRRRSSRSRRGGVLLLALIATIAVAATIASLLQLNIAVTRRQAQSLDTKRAFYLAEAGLSEAFSGLTIGKTGNVGTAEQPAMFGEGLVWVEAVEQDEERVELTSTGMCGRSRAVLSLVAERGQRSVASLGVFADQALSVPVGTTIEGYDSSQPAQPGGATPAGGGSAAAIGRLGSNAGIEAKGTLKKPTVIRANVECGPQHEITFNSNVAHLGTKETRGSTIDLPAVEPPFEPGTTVINHKGRTPRVINAPQVALSRLQVAASSQVIVRGPCEMVVGGLTLASGAQLELDTTLGPISIWATKTLTLPDGSLITTTSNDPSKLALQTPTAEPVTLKATGTFTGMIYAPAAQATLGDKMRVRGALVAKQLVLTSGAKLSFDQHLDEVAQQLALPQLMSWRIVELGDTNSHSPSANPFDLLEVDRATLPELADAHEDQQLHIVYVDNGGATRTYDGLESGFDWSNVRSVVELSRDGRAVLYQPDDVAGGGGATPASPAQTAIDDVAIPSNLLSALLKTLTMTTSEVVSVIGRTPPLSHSDLRDVLVDHAPLGSTELNAAIDAGILDSSDLRDVLVASSPLPLDVLARVIAGIGVLNLSHKLAVLAAQ